MCIRDRGNAGASEASEHVHSQNESSDEDADDGAVEGEFREVKDPEKGD